MRYAFLVLISTLLCLSSCAEVPTRRDPSSPFPFIPVSQIRLSDVPQMIADAHRQLALHRWGASISIAMSVIEFLKQNGLVYSVDMIYTYTVLADAYYHQGNYELCITTCMKAFMVSMDPELQREHGSHNPIRSLGDLYKSMGNSEYAAELYEAAYRIALHHHGSNSLDIRVMKLLDGRDEFNQLTGMPRADSKDKYDYIHSKTEPMRKLLIDIEEELKQCGSRRNDQDCTWNSHGMGYDRRNLIRAKRKIVENIAEILAAYDYKKEKDLALEAYVQALESTFESATKSSRSWFHSQFGHIYLMQRDIARAKSRFLLAKGMVSDHLELVYRNANSYERIISAEECSNRNLAWIERNLSTISMLENDIEDAESHMKKSINLSLPRVNPNQIKLGSFVRIRERLDLLAQIYWMNNKTTDAIKAWIDATDISEENFRGVRMFENETVLLGEIDSLRKISQTIISTIYMEQNKLRHPLLAKLALSSTLLSQARVADVLHEKIAPYSSPKSAQEREIIHQVRALRFQLAALESTPIHGQPHEAADERRSLLHKVERLEAQLRQMTGIREVALPLSEGIVYAVAAKLPQDAVLIDYVQFQLLDPRIPENDQKDRFRYIALVLYPNGRTAAVDLGDAHEINRIVHRLHSDLSQGRPDYVLTARAAYERLIGPLIPILSNVQNLYLVPDSDLHLLPFEVLSDGAKTLTERFSVSYLSSGRDLLRGSSAAPRDDAVVVFANPDVRARLDSAGALVASSETMPTTKDAVAAFEHTRSLTIRRAPARSAKHEVERLVELPGAEGEAQAIADRIPSAVILRRENATEKHLFEMKQAPKILHFATHGLYFGDQSDCLVTPSQRSGPPVDSDDQLPNPLVRSALVLAGAAHGRMSRDSGYDGLVTALEISSVLALKGTKLVVLSACESARGVVLQGEGVASLQRAFLIAGSESVVASLWKVNDDVTKQLMTAFYTFLRAGNSRSVALRRAAAQVRSSPEYAHPYYWAGFVLVGQDGPIDGLK